MKLSRIIGVLAVLSLLGIAFQAHAGTYTVLGPETYIRATGSPIVEVLDFQVNDPSASYTLTIYNGGLEDDEVTGDRVSSSVIMMNGIEVVGPSEFNQSVAVITKPLSLKSTNEFSVELRGKPGGLLYILIEGEDDAPPTIEVTAPAALVANDRQPEIVVGYADDLADVDLSAFSESKALINLDGPVFDHTGRSQFEYEITDPDGATSIGKVIQWIYVDNSAPTAVNDRFAPTVRTLLHLEEIPFENDTDPDSGDELRYGQIFVEDPAMGTVSEIFVQLKGEGDSLDGIWDSDVQFLPDTQFSGEVILHYTAIDNVGEESNFAKIVIPVIGPNKPPVAMDDASSADEDVPVVLTPDQLLANDEDPDFEFDFLDESHSVVSVGSAANGTVALDGSGDIVFTPSLDFSGAASFEYTVQDRRGAQSTATVFVTVTPVADTPMIIVDDDGFDSAELQPLPGFWTASLSDTDGSETLSIRIEFLPEGWTVTGGADLGGGEWLVPEDQIDTAGIIPGADSAGQPVTFLISAMATEIANGDSATTSPEIIDVTILKGIDIAENCGDGAGACIDNEQSLVSEFAGFSVDIIGDLNGDGLDELLIGAPEAEPGSLRQRGRPMCCTAEPTAYRLI